MTQVARKGDQCQGVCHHPSHVGGYSTTAVIIGSASTTVGDNEKGIARVGDRVQTTCGHLGVIVTGSSTFNVENKPVARVGDQVSNTEGTHFIGVIIEGSDNIETP